jgi:hypothetical protein
MKTTGTTCRSTPPRRRGRRRRSGGAQQRLGTPDRSLRRTRSTATGVGTHLQPRRIDPRRDTGDPGRHPAGQSPRSRSRATAGPSMRGPCRPKSSTGAGRLATLVQGTGTVGLDMVSLFPKGHLERQGKTASARTSPRRSMTCTPGPALPRRLHRQHRQLRHLLGPQLHAGPNLTQWKDTIGPVEQRPANRNFWGYNQTYGLGYMEYFQWAEDHGGCPRACGPGGRDRLRRQQPGPGPGNA